MDTDKKRMIGLMDDWMARAVIHPSIPFTPIRVYPCPSVVEKL
jgi:hypothetical protein